MKFFSRTGFTRALGEHMGMVLRRLAGRTENSAPVMTLVTQFAGGKTHADGTVPSGKAWKRCEDARQLIEAIHAIDPEQPIRRAHL